MAGQDANTSRASIRATLNSLEVNKQNQNGPTQAKMSMPTWKGKSTSGMEQHPRLSGMKSSKK